MDETINETEKDNIIALPDLLHFWRCSLCGLNIKASMSENGNGPGPAIFTTQESDERMIFCGPCASKRQSDVNRYIGREVVKARRANDNVSFLNQVVGNSKVWRIFESERKNSFGEILKLRTWWSRSSGLLAALFSSKNEKENLIGFNLGGMTVGEFEFACKYINATYSKDYGKLVEKEKHRAIVGSPRLPVFRCLLLGTTTEMCVFDEPIGLCLGSTELLLSREDFVEFAAILSATVSFIQLGTISRLETIKSKFLKEDRPTKIASKSIIETSLASKRKLRISKWNKSVSVEIDFVRIDIEITDFIDCSNILDKLIDCLDEKNVKRKNKMLENLRNDRYVRIGSYVPLSCELIMKDLGWTFGLGEFLNLI